MRRPVMASVMAKVEAGGEPGHVGEGVDVAGCDAAAVGGDGAAEERGVLVILGDPCAPFGCQGTVDTGSVIRWRGHHRGPWPAERPRHWPVEAAPGSPSGSCRRPAPASGQGPGPPAASWAGVAWRLGLARLDAVEVGGDQAVLRAAPQDLRGGGLPAGAQALVAELADGGQAAGGAVVRAGGQAVAVAVGVVVVDPACPGTAGRRPDG